uniref:Uncharacterized protein n=1 Tax=Nothobranchius furzeri TaxID=105023 RepID=A0A1A8U5N4_NOTFU
MQITPWCKRGCCHDHMGSYCQALASYDVEVVFCQNSSNRCASVMCSLLVHRWAVTLDTINKPISNSKAYLASHYKQQKRGHTLMYYRCLPVLLKEKEASLVLLDDLK